MTTIENIIALARKFASARIKLAAIVDSIHGVQQAALNNNRAALRAAACRANDTQEELATAIASAPELFTKPRTINVDGIRLGLTTKKGKVSFEDADDVVARIRRAYSPELQISLLRIKTEPNKEALENLDDAALKRLGVTRTPEDPNAVTIRPTDSAVDKLVASLLEKVEASATEELVA
jgi:hypothetical protein